MIWHWFIKKVPPLLGLCAVMIGLAFGLGQIAPPRPQIYYGSWEFGKLFFLILRDVDRNFSLNSSSFLSLPIANDWVLSPDEKHFLICTAFDLMIVDNHGRNPQWLTQDSMNNHSPAWSPDGKHIAFISERDNNGELYVMDYDGNNQRRLTVSDSYEALPSWSPDGSQILFSIYKGSEAIINVIDRDGNNLRSLTSIDHHGIWPAWSPDGQHITFVSFRGGDGEIYVMDRHGGNQHPLTENDNNDITPSWSPDGKQIVFSSDRIDSKYSIFIMDADGKNQHFVVTTDNGNSVPSWSPDGRYIMFQAIVGNIGKTYIMNSDGSNLRLGATWIPPLYHSLWFIP